MTRHRAEKRTDTIDDDDCLAIFSGESVVIEFNEPQRLTLEANLPVKMKMRMLCVCGADWNDDGGRKHETPNSFAEKRCQASCKRWLLAAVRCANKWIGLIQLYMERTLRRFPLPQRQQVLERLCEGDCSEEKTSGISVCGYQ